MARQTVEQATCDGCGESEDNHTVEDTDMGYDDKGEGYVTHELRCTCGESGSVTIGSGGIEAAENVSHEDASWNEEDDDE